MTAGSERANPPLPRPQRPATLTFTQSILALEAFVAIFAMLMLWGLGRAGEVEAPAWLVWGCGVPLVVALGYATGRQRTRWGRWLGWALQVPLLVAGLVEPAIAIMGVVFLGLWIMALRLGGRIDRERAERVAAAAGRTRGAVEAE